VEKLALVLEVVERQAVLGLHPEVPSLECLVALESLVVFVVEVVHLLTP
jgi:hypothetical protein